MTLMFLSFCRYEYGSKHLGMERRRVEDRKVRRYFRRRVADESDSTAVAERAASYRRLLEEKPRDIALWEKYIDFMVFYFRTHLYTPNLHISSRITVTADNMSSVKKLILALT